MAVKVAVWQSLQMQSDICFPASPANLSIFAAFSFSFAVAGFTFIFPEEPPPRPPQPAVLIKSKCGSPQQLLTHCSCPLYSLLAPLLRGTSHSFLLSLFAVVLPFAFISSLNMIVSPSLYPCVPLTGL